MAGGSSATLLGVMVIAGGFAVLTKPPRDAYAPELAQLIVEETAPRISAALGGAQSVTGLGGVNAEFIEQCYGDPRNCARFFRGRLSLDEDDYVVMRLARLERGEASLQCYGGYNTWKCWFDAGVEAPKAES